jgi:hypothetical protein
MNVDIGTNVTVTFSEAMNATTVNDATVELRDPANVKRPANVTYDAATFRATLDPTAPLASGVTYTILVKGGNTDPRVKDVAGNALATDAASTFTTIPAPPTVVSSTPAPGSNGVPVNIAPTAKFSSALNPSTVNTDTVLLENVTDPSNPVPVAVTVSYEPNVSTVALVPTAPLQPGRLYQVTLRGGSPGPSITDTIGQLLAGNVKFTFTTALAGSGVTTFTVFTNQTPDIPDVDEGAPRELGMKFSANQDGVVTGVRFFKGTDTDNGTHIGHLWTIGGTLLGEVTFPVDTPIEWKQANFSTPIAITAGTTYVVSYLTPLGRYSATNRAFENSGVDNGPNGLLHALSHLEAGGNPGGNLDGNGNGVFWNPDLDPPGGFPTRSFLATNYFVDVVFSSEPQVLSVTPAPGAANVPTNFQPTATFSETIPVGSLTTDTVQMITAGGVTVPINSVSFNPSTFTITIVPQQDLQPNRAYTVILKGGASGITDSTGNPLSVDYIWSFTTAP